MSEKELKLSSKRDDTKLLAVSNIVAALLSNEEGLDELSKRAGVYSDINEVVVGEALTIFDLIEENI